MNLQKKIEEITKESLGNNVKGLSNIAKAETILKQSYEGRYLFELIQNVRDACKEKQFNGKILIELSNDELIVSNTGGEFSLDGIESITNIGDSTKHSQDFIGHKGIGFKSILEICNNPIIMTKYGSVYFSKTKTVEKHSRFSEVDIDKIPLFFFPHFSKESIDQLSEYVTRIVLPFKKGITAKRISEDLKLIHEKQIVLLGNLEKIIYKYKNKKISFYEIRNNTTVNSVEIESRFGIKYYKSYSPANPIEIPELIIDELDKQEKDLFVNNRFIDVKLLLKLDEKKHFSSIDDAKLYLFYPLKISSGFKFLIHSYFIVSPNRKELRDNPLNTFLLGKIGDFIANDFLRKLKRSYKNNLLNILIYDRESDASLIELYDSVQKGLADKKFIFDKYTKKFYKPSEIIIARGFDKNLFPDGKLEGKIIIYLDNKITINWLKNEFDIEVIDNYTISEVIERECSKQLKKKNYLFFQNLYNYLTQRSELNLKDKKVLVTSYSKLVTSNEDVFYGGTRTKIRSIPKSIRKKIHFIHPEITIEDFREGSSQTGIKEYSTYELVKRLIKLFEVDDVSNDEILNLLFDLELDKKSLLDLKGKIYLPIQNSNEWKNPLYEPLYIESEELKELYTNGFLIDHSIFNETSIDKINEFLLQVGVWDIPAIYIKDRQVVENDSRTYEKLSRNSTLYSRPFYITNNRVLDKPESITKWFSEKIIKHWIIYYDYLTDTSLPNMQYSSSYSSNHGIPYPAWTYSDFIDFIADTPWIVLNEGQAPLSIKEIIACDPKEFPKQNIRMISKYLNILPLDFQLYKVLIEETGLLHLSGNSIKNYIKLFNNVREKFEEIPERSDFKSFYNRLLSKLFDFYEYILDIDERDEIQDFDEVEMLSFNEYSQLLVWRKAKDIYYIDNLAFYRQLPEEIKKQLQPHFTTRDKNTFGRIALKIGRKISDSVSLSIIESEKINEIKLINRFKHLAQIITLLEFDIDRSLKNEEIENIKNSFLIFHNHIPVEVTFGNEIKEIIPMKFFTERRSKYYLHIQLINANEDLKVLSEAVSNLFSNISGMNLKRFEIDFYHFLTNENKLEFLNSFDLSKERMKEIQLQLDDKIMNNVQNFFFSILYQKNLITEENMDDILHQDFINIEYIEELLQINLGDFLEYFIFDDLNSLQNVRPLKTFFKEIEISLNHYNRNCFPEINFVHNYEMKLNQLKNKFSNKIELHIWNKLKDMDIKEQAKYQSLLDTYNAKSSFELDKNVFDIDINSYFVLWFNKHFSNFKVESYKYIDNFNLKRTPLEAYKLNKKKFETDLEKHMISLKHVDVFLASKEINSLLYFGYHKSILEKYKSNYINKSKKSNDDIDFDELFNFDEFILSPGNEIKQVDPKSLSNGNGRNKKSKRKRKKRYDGSYSNMNKEMVGFIAEKLVFELLLRKDGISNPKWVSKNASKIPESHNGYNPEGDDSLHYDIEYVDMNNNKIYIEVKGRKNDENSFEITKAELDFAIENGDKYSIIFVSNVLDNANRSFRELSNPFMYDEGESFFSNSKFTASNKNFVIQFD